MLLTALTFSVMAPAEVYKWQDETGRWHFSDQAPATGRQATRVDLPDTSSAISAVDNPTSTGRDLHKQLTERFRPEGVIEETTLAVVGIETPLGQGSGFFISTTGHILTNRHVVRPDTTPDWQKNRELGEEAGQRLREFKGWLDEEQRRLTAYASKLAIYRQEIAGKSEGSARSLAQAEYREYEQAYEQRKQAWEDQQSRYRQLQGEHDRKMKEFNLNSSLAGAANRFRVYLKDNTALQARLIQVSRTLDLALLRLEGYTTPALRAGEDRRIGQGARVYAIGSPMGMRDSVTAGIITRLQEDYLVTDAQILPGNSGGPLTDESGLVLGVNTLKYAEKATASGFGLAIPIAAAMNEFGAYLR